MPRKKEFDVDTVLHRAMEAFWKHGYEATSLNDLLDCMQIQRASLYNAFGDKHTLFLETLRLYAARRRIEILNLTKTLPPRQAILGLFQDTITAVLEKKHRNGCFLINTALELSPHDKEAAEIVRVALTYMEKQFFQKLIEKGRAIGEISKSVIPTHTARALLSLFIGLRVLSRSRPERLLLESIANQAESLLPLGDQATHLLTPAHAVAVG